jgi:hypothetical protein
VSKPSDNVLLAPGESGWELWTAAPGGPFTLLTAGESSRAADLAGLPSGELTLLFPVKSFTAVPLRVTSHDEALFADLAAMHAERLGLRPDPMAGQLADTFEVVRDDEGTTLLSVVLRTPGEGELPVRGPKEFDLSARAIAYHGDSLVLWKEFGRWVFAVSKAGKLAYCQATSIAGDEPDDALVRETRLALAQLSMQGLSIHPSRVVVLASGEPSLSALVRAFGGVVELRPRPAPVLPEPRSKLLPADVRAARHEAMKRQRVRVAVAAVALVYLGAASWFGFTLWKDVRETKKLRESAKAAAPEGEAYAAHIAKWDELGPVVDNSKSPVELLYRASRAIPRNQGVRLKTAEVSSDGVIKLIGDAPEPKPVLAFSLALSKSDLLAGYAWEAPPPNQTNKGAEFVYTGTAPGAVSP